MKIIINETKKERKSQNGNYTSSENRHKTNKKHFFGIQTSAGL